MKKPLFLIFVFLSTLACGNSEKSSADKNTNPSNKSNVQSPCKLLTETEIKNILSIPSEAETSIKEKNKTYSACFYKWESVSWPYKVMGYASSYQAEMSIVLVNDVTKEQYKQSIAVYKDGEVEKGVGEMATWSKKKTQITFLYKGNLVHVSSRTSADAASNKTKTIALAKLIIKKL